MPAEPKRMELAGCGPGEILFVCFLPARVSLLLLPIDLVISLLGLSWAMTSLNFEVLFF